MKSFFLTSLQILEFNNRSTSSKFQRRREKEAEMEKHISDEIYSKFGERMDCILVNEKVQCRLCDTRIQVLFDENFEQPVLEELIAHLDVIHDLKKLVNFF